jgi:tripartite-type tricarboxylate transporter receptor subunit TctC
MQKMLKSLLVAGTLITGALATALPARAQQMENYAGKTLTIVVGLAAGGSADTLVRLFVPHLKKHIPGEPNIVVQNMPGAGGVLAFNYIYEKAKPDGQTIIMTLWDPLAQALGDQGLRARYDQFEYLGGISDIRVNYMRVDAVPGGAKKPADIMKASNIAIGAYATTDISGILSHLSLKTLGVLHKVVTGYLGGAEVFLALQRGEVHVHNTSIGTYRTRSKAFITSGDGMGLSYLVPSNEKGEYKRDPRITDMPVFQDLYKEIHGKLPEGEQWNAFNWAIQQFGDLAYVAMAPPNTPAPFLNALRKGIKDAMADPAFIDESTKRNGLPFDYVGIEEGRKVFRDLSNVSPAVLNTLRGNIGGMGGVK